MKKIVLAVLATTVAGCTAPLYVEIEEPSLCVVRDVSVDATFAGASVSADQLDAAASQLATDLGTAVGDTFTVSDNDVKVPSAFVGALDLVVQVRELTFTPLDGADLSGVQRVTIALRGPAGSGLPDATLVSFVRTAPSEPIVASGDRFDVADYVAPDGTVRFDYGLLSSLPPGPWTAQLKACFYVKARVNYLDAAF